jgi:hypothetical protein
MKEARHVHRAKLILFLANLALFAGVIGRIRQFGPTWSDGH